MGGMGPFYSQNCFFLLLFLYCILNTTDYAIDDHQSLLQILSKLNYYFEFQVKTLIYILKGNIIIEWRMIQETNFMHELLNI